MVTAISCWQLLGFLGFTLKWNALLICRYDWPLYGRINGAAFGCHGKLKICSLCGSLRADILSAKLIGHSLSQLANCLKSLLMDQEKLSCEWTLFMQKARAFCFLLKTLFNSKAPSIYKILNSTVWTMSSNEWILPALQQTSSFLTMGFFFFFWRENCFLNVTSWLHQVWNGKWKNKHLCWLSLAVPFKACQTDVILGAFYSADQDTSS